MLDSNFGSAESQCATTLFYQRRGSCGLSTQTKPVSLTMASLGDHGRSKPTITDTAEEPDKCSWL